MILYSGHSIYHFTIRRDFMNPNLKNDSSVKIDLNDSINNGSINIDNSRKTKIAIGSVVGIVALIVIGFFIFKGSSLDSKLVGTWSGNDSAMIDRYHYAGDIVFKSDHTFVTMNHDDIPSEGTWKTNSSKNLILTANGYSWTLVWNDNVNWTSESASWNLSGDVMYIGTTRYDRQ